MPPTTTDRITLHNKVFSPRISATEIQHRVQQVAHQINTDYAGKKILFVSVLNGSFMFASDLLKSISLECRISFVKVSSYNGTMSTGQLKTILGLEESVFGQSVIIVEDIVDTGLTLQKIVAEIESLGANSVETVSLLRKKPARDKGIEVKYVGFELDHEFVVGYGLDFDGLGRNLPNLYQADA